MYCTQCWGGVEIYVCIQLTFSAKSKQNADFSSLLSSSISTRLPIPTLHLPLSFILYPSQTRKLYSKLHHMHFRHLMKPAHDPGFHYGIEVRAQHHCSACPPRVSTITLPGTCTASVSHPSNVNHHHRNIVSFTTLYLSKYTLFSWLCHGMP